MYSLLLLICCSFVLSLILTPLCGRLAARAGWVDRPDGERKIHKRPVPRVGGIPIALSYVIAFAILMLSPMSAGGIVRRALPLVWQMLPAAALVFAVGLLDDIFRLRPWQKLAAEVVAAGLAWSAGIQIHSVAGHALPIWCAMLVTLFWLVGCCNAVNLIDGIDGLAAGVGLFASLTTLVAALLNGDIRLVLATGALGGSLLGFLCYNFNPASIFLGDSGSLLIGFLLGCYGALWTQKSATLLGMTAPMMALSLPLLDTTLAIARRFLRRQPIFGADRSHIHHKLLERGFTHRSVAALLYGACCIAAIFSLLQTAANPRYNGLIVLLFSVTVLIAIDRLGYVELHVAGRMLRTGAFRHMVGANVSLRQFESMLESAKTADECWDVIRSRYEEFGFASIEIRLSSYLWEEKRRTCDTSAAWTLRIALAGDDYVILRRDPQNPAPPATAAFADALGNALRRKLPDISGEHPDRVAGAAIAPLSRAAAGAGD